MIKDSNLGSKKNLIQSIISAEPMVYGAVPTSATGVKFAFHSGDAIAAGEVGQIVFNKLTSIDTSTGVIVINGEIVSSKILDTSIAQKSNASTGVKTVTVKYVGAGNTIVTDTFEVIDDAAVKAHIAAQAAADKTRLDRLDSSVNTLETYVAATNISSSKKDIVVTATEGTTGKTYDVSVNIDGATIIRNADTGVLSAGKTLSIVDENVYYKAGDDIPEGKQVGDVKTAGHKYIALTAADGTTNEGKIDLCSIVGNGLIKSSVYNKETGILTLTWNSADGTEKNTTEINLGDLLDINDMSVVDDSQKYLTVNLTGGENSQAVFTVHTQNVATASAAVLYAEGDEIPEGKNVGDVKVAAVTGVADAADVKAYVDSKVADKNVSAEGDDYVSASAADNKVTVDTDVQDVTGNKGAAGVYDSEGAQTTAPTHGTLVGVEKTLMDSKQAIEKVKDYVDGEVAIEAARADANVLAAVKALDQADASVSATNVAFNYGVTDGITHINGLKVDYATVTKTATTSTATTPATDAALTVTNGSQLAIGSDIEKVAQYAADKVTEEAHRVNKKIADLTGEATSDKVAGVQTKVTTVAGEVNTVVVTVDDNAVIVGGDKDARTIAPTSTTAVLKGDAIAQIATYVANVAADASANAFASAKAALDSSIAGLDADKTSDDAAVATVRVVEVDGKISDVVVTNISAGVAREAGGATTRDLTATTATGAVTGADIATIKGYVDDRISDLTGAQDSSVKINDSFITAVVEMTDGSLNQTKSSLSYVKAVYNAESNAVTTNGLADGQWVLDVVNDRINDLDLASSAADASALGTNVKVRMSQTNGILKVEGVDESYASFTATAAGSSTSNGKTTITNNGGSYTVADADAGKLVKASDLTAVYAAAKADANKYTEVALTWSII